MPKAREMTGTIRTHPVNKGSKSESNGYFLVNEGGWEKRVRLKGENPFEQPTLKSLVGKRVRLEGCQEHHDLIICEKASLM